MNNLFSYSNLLMQSMVFVLILGIAACGGKKTAKSPASSQKIVEVTDVADTNAVAKTTTKDKKAKPQPPTPPPPKQPIEVLNIAEDKAEIEEELSPEESDLDEIEVVGYEDEVAYSSEYEEDEYIISTLSTDTRKDNFNTESYDKISENEFVSSIANPLSTFSVDVDRAAYANVRRYLNSNNMPPKDAVRIEELINYFNYTYPHPKNSAPFSVNLEMTTCPWNTKHSLISIGLKGKELEAENLPQSNLVFLIDVSGSMSDENKLPLLKQSFKILIDKLRPNDRVAMVVYAGAAGVVLPSTQCSEKETILKALDKLEAGGSTAGGAGIKLAYKIAKENFKQEGNNRVILATDGDFNIGESSGAEMQRLIERKRDEGIFLTVLGFGMGNYKDSKMEILSNSGNGNYAYIDNILEAKKTLGKEFFGTLYTIAKDVKIQIEFNPANVKAYRLIGYENRMLKKEDFNDDKKDAGEIGAGHTVTAIYEIIPAGSKEKVPGVDELEYQKTRLVKSDDIMTLKLRYKMPDASKSKLLKYKIKKEDIERKPSENFNWSMAVAEFGLLLRDSKFKANSSFKHVISLAKENKGKDADGNRAEFIKLAETAELISGN